MAKNEFQQTGGPTGIVGRTGPEGIEGYTKPQINRHIEKNPETFHARLEKAARHVVREAAELKGGYLISPETMAMLKTVLGDKPKEGVSR